MTRIKTIITDIKNSAKYNEPVYPLTKVIQVMRKSQMTCIYRDSIQVTYKHDDLPEFVLNFVRTGRPDGIEMQAFISPTTYIPNTDFDTTKALLLKVRRIDVSIDNIAKEVDKFSIIKKEDVEECIKEQFDNYFKPSNALKLAIHNFNKVAYDDNWTFEGY